MRRKGDTRDLAIAALAARQHGVVTTGQLEASGLSWSSIGRRVDAARIHRVHRGVYAVGHPGLSPEGRWLAAVLACGTGAVLSHGDAAVLWGLLRPLGGPPHVSVPTVNGVRQRRGIRLHRCRSLRGALVTRRLGIPVTTPARTIVDLQGTVAPRLQRRARRQAEVLGLLGEGEAGFDRTRSDLEDSFLRLCRSRRLPLPEVNARVAGVTVDFAWPLARLLVETDGYAYHHGRVAFEDDRARGVRLRELGYDLIRVADSQLRDEPARVASLVAEALRQRLPAP